MLPGGLVVTVDSLVEGVHFTADADPHALGHKVLAASVSDVLAMGATPHTAFLAMSLPRATPAWIDAFADGLAQACARYGVHLAGGDTTGSPGPRFLSLTLLGSLRDPTHPWTRAGARPGDRLLVTGTLGDAGAGWMHREPSPGAREALGRPQPPFAFAQQLDPGLVHAAMDLSDGLALDLPRLCAASGVGARVEPSRLPASPEVAAASDRLTLQVCGGEDYQLLLAVPAGAVGPCLAAAEASGTRLTDIGVITAHTAVVLAGLDWPRRSFDHFGGAP